MSSPKSPVRVAELPNRGRSIIATDLIKPGQIILTDSPLLLYPSSLSSLSSFCSHCFRALPSEPLPCSSCHVALFCSVRCLSFSHPSLLCLSLPSLTSLPSVPPELLFLLSAYSLPSSSLVEISSLHSDSALLSNEQAQNLHSQLGSLIPSNLIPATYFSLETTALLLAKENVNSFCIMNPIESESSTIASGIRASGIYMLASRFNHDCLPNACRFDYFDDPNRENNTDIIIRALHEIPEGKEVCVSYFRVNKGYKERQSKLMEIYGFKCECERCRHEMERMEGGGNGDDFQHAEFFERFMCEKDNCGGTMAPLPPSNEGIVSDVLECNVCGIRVVSS
ncbi:hypothetical protein LUZ60_001994 [Juncus effusus]|nr:hypothetical protein LUZ60_001994 [Juncus effusus]